MNILPSVAIVCLALLVEAADSWGPFPKIYSSGKSQFVVRVEPGIWSESPRGRTNATARIHRYEVAKQRYEPVCTFLLENSIMPLNVLVSDDGERIVTVDHSSGNSDYQKPVMVVYDSKGTVLRRFHLKDILSPKEIEELRPSERSIRWLPWNIEVNLHAPDDEELLILRDHVDAGPGKKHDNLVVNLKTFKVSRETNE